MQLLTMPVEASAISFIFCTFLQAAKYFKCFNLVRRKFAEKMRGSYVRYYILVDKCLLSLFFSTICIYFLFRSSKLVVLLLLLIRKKSIIKIKLF